MQLLVVNYHYINYSGKRILVRGINEKIFEKQLKELKERYIPITFQDYYRITKDKKKNNNRYVIVTFDDGLKDGLRAFLIAKRLKFPITFFICGLPQKERRVLAVQKSHLLLEKIGTDFLIKVFYQELQKYRGEIRRLKSRELNVKDINPYDKGPIRKFKLDINYLLPHKIRDRVLNKIFKKYFPNEKKIAQELYLNYEDLKKIVKNNFELGGHSYSHFMLAQLSPKEQENEIKKSREVLNKINLKPLPFSVPFGHIGTFNETTKKLLKKYNFFNLVTMKRKMNVNNYDHYNISRFDVNDVFEGPKLKNYFF